MISAISADSPLPGGPHMADYRNRTSRGERAVMADSTPPTQQGPDTRNNRQPHAEHKETAAQPDAAPRDPSTMFAAAVIAGTLPPVPQTMEQLIQRIGISPIPEESQARLKDLLA
jgi:hypothetical protein